jgi:hypothetical protein
MEAVQGMAIGANKLENCKSVLLSVILSHTSCSSFYVKFKWDNHTRLLHTRFSENQLPLLQVLGYIPNLD